MSPEDKELFDLYESMSDEELVDLSDEEFAEYESFTEMAAGGADTVPTSDTIEKQADPYVAGTPEFEARMSQLSEEKISDEARAKRAQIKSDWDKMDRFEKGAYLSKVTGQPAEYMSDVVVSMPYTALEYVMSDEMGDDEPGTLSNVKTGLYDLFSAGGRMVGAGIDAALSPKKFAKDPENLVEGFSKREGEISEGDEQRSFVGNLGQSVVRDPYNPLFLPVEGGKSALDVVDKMFPQMAKKAAAKGGPLLRQRAAVSALEGGAEEVVRGAVEGELNPETLLFGTAASGIAGGAGGALIDKSAEKFGRLIPNAKMRNLKNTPQGPANVRKTFEELPLFSYDYNVPGRMGKISDEISDLGSRKRSGMEDVQAINQEIPQFLPDPEKAASTLEESLVDNLRMVQEQVANKKVSPEYAKAYTAELGSVVNQFLRKTDIDPAKMLKEGSSFPADVSGNIKAINSAVSDGVETSPFLDDIVHAFDARISLDKELDRFYKKAGRDVKVTEKEDAYHTARILLNKHITNLMDDVESRMLVGGNMSDLLQSLTGKPAEKAKYEKAFKAIQDIREGMIETEKLPSLYAQQDILKTIGAGGDVSTTASKKIGTGGDLQGLVDLFAPQSGIRGRQIGSFLANPLAQKHVKDESYRDKAYEKETPLFR